MSLQVNHTPTATLVTLDGPNVDVRQSETLKSAFKSLVTAGMPPVIIDANQVMFVDSAGLGVFLFIKRLCDQNSIHIAMCALQPQFAQLAALTNLSRAVSLYDTLDDALAAVPVAE